MSLKTYLIGASLLIAAFFAYCYQTAQMPDQELVFTREVPSDIAPAVLSERLSSVKQWPKWFYATTEAKILDSSDPILKTGSIVRLQIDPKKGKYRRFEITVKVIEFVSEKKLELQVLGDSKGMLFKLFDRINWKIEIFPNPQGFLIQGIETAHTASWRSRLFGKLSKRILMHQVFYPDLMKLAESHPPVDSSED